MESAYCDACDGTGGFDHDSDDGRSIKTVKCHKCNGTGKVYDR
jgi:DnaJ-class molecular chaperone